MNYKQRLVAHVNMKSTFNCSRSRQPLRKSSMTIPSRPQPSGSSLPEQDQRGQRLSLSRRPTGDPVSLALGLALARSLLNLDGILAMVMDLINWLSGPLQDREESHSGSSRRAFWNNDPCALFWLHLPKASFPKASCLLPSTVLFYLIANRNAGRTAALIADDLLNCISNEESVSAEKSLNDCSLEQSCRSSACDASTLANVDY